MELLTNPECNGPNCTNPPLKNGYCFLHQNLATDKKPVKKRIQVDADNADESDTVADSVEILVANIRNTYDFIRVADGLYWRKKVSDDIWQYDAAPLIEQEIWKHRSRLSGSKYAYTSNFINSVQRAIMAECGLPEEWRPPPSTEIPFLDGIYNWETQEFRKGYTSYDHHTTTLDVPYKPDAEPGFLDQLMVDWIGDDTTVLYQIIGLSMLQGIYPASKIFMLYGKGADGKSRYLDVIRGILGTHNISGVTPQALVTQPFSRCNLHGKMANIVGDIPYDSLHDASTIKLLTGEEFIDADRKYRQPITFKSYATLLFSTNQLPRIYDNSDGLWRRVFLLEFPNQRPRHMWDTALPGKIAAAKNELAAVAAKAARMLKRLCELGWELKGESSITDTRQRYTSISDPIQYFVENFCEEADAEGVTVMEFHKAINQWAEENGLNKAEFTKRKINKSMDTAKIKKMEQRETRSLYWQGIVLSGTDAADI